MDRIVATTISTAVSRPLCGAIRGRVGSIESDVAFVGGPASGAIPITLLGQFHYSCGSRRYSRLQLAVKGA